MDKNKKITLKDIEEAAEYIFRNRPKKTTDIETALNNLFGEVKDICKVIHKDGQLYGSFSTNGMITGLKGIIKTFELTGLLGWDIYYNGVKLTDVGKEEFYKFLKEYEL